MKVMEFSENTKVDCVVPEWAKFMDKGDHISYMPSFKGGEFLGLFDERICTAPENQPPFDSMTCYLFDPTKHGRDRNGKYPLLIFIHGATNALDGRKCVILIFNQHIDKIQSLPVILLMVSLDNEQIVSQSLSTTF